MSNCPLPSPEATEALGARLAGAVPAGAVVYLCGDLGAGKTTLARGWLRALGHTGAVRSPTYTLVEPYALAEQPVVHLDLYRLTDPRELEFLGVRDFVDGRTVMLVEWPERGHGVLPPPDLTVELRYAGDGRSARLQARSALGEAALAACRQSDSETTD